MLTMEPEAEPVNDEFTRSARTTWFGFGVSQQLSLTELQSNPLLSHGPPQKCLVGGLHGCLRSVCAFGMWLGMGWLSGTLGEVGIW